MRGIGALILILLLGLGALGFYVWSYPGSLYKSWMSGSGYNRYYSIYGYRDLYLHPKKVQEIENYKEEYPELWKDFPLKSTMIPMPVRHPFFNTVPILEYDQNGKSLQLGMSLENSSGRENSRIYALPTGAQIDYTAGLELFKLPYVRNRLVKRSPDEVWKDTFSKDLTGQAKTLDEMIYELYVLYIRSVLLPKGTLAYGLIPETNKAVIELSSKDKDYIMELILILERGSVYSFVLRTEKNNEESKKLRSKFLTSINFSPSDVAMARILYTEFKQLNFTRQVDQEGMIYLYSAWSQDTSNVDLLKEMIFYLERGSKYHKHLSSFYKYAHLRYGKTFTTRDVFTDRDDPEIALQRKIELEAMSKRRDLSDRQIESASELTPEERMNKYLKEAKEAGPIKKDEMTIH